MKFKFHCLNCGKQFSLFRQSMGSTKLDFNIECPHCGAMMVEKSLAKVNALTIITVIGIFFGIPFLYLTTIRQYSYFSLFAGLIIALLALQSLLFLWIINHGNLQLIGNDMKSSVDLTKEISIRPLQLVLSVNLVMISASYLIFFVPLMRVIFSDLGLHLVLTERAAFFVFAPLLLLFILVWGIQNYEKWALYMTLAVFLISFASVPAMVPLQLLLSRPIFFFAIYSSIAIGLSLYGISLTWRHIKGLRNIVK